MLRRARGGPEVLVGVYRITSNLRSIEYHLTKQIPEVVPRAKSPLDVLQIEWKVFSVLAKLNCPKTSRKACPALIAAI